MGETSIDRFIQNRKSSIISANSCDYKTTSRHELDSEEKRCRERYSEGERLVAEIGEEDLERCRRLYRLEHSDYGADYLREDRVYGKWVIVPAHVTLIERMRSLKEALA